MTIGQINDLAQGKFVEAVGWVYEGSPWVAERAWASRPFESLDDLARKMNAVVEAASIDEQLKLLRAHPELGTRLKVSQASAEEQAGAGLDHLSESDIHVMRDLNDKYQEKFGFPFIYAVKGSGHGDILWALTVRVDSDEETELQAALWEVSRIARFRLQGIVKD